MNNQLKGGFSHIPLYPRDGTWRGIPDDEVELNRVRRKAADLLAEMNAKHCVLLAKGKIASLSNDKWFAQTKSDFTFRYCNQYVMLPGADRSITLAQWWLHHPDRRQCEGMVLSPGGPVPSDEEEQCRS
jgi:hypothetical protein